VEVSFKTVIKEFYHSNVNFALLQNAMSQPKFQNWLLFSVLSLVWGSSFILMKKSAENLTGWQIGATRIFSAGLVFFPFAIFHLRSIPRNKLLMVILSGILGNLLPAFLFAIAIEENINSSVAAILNSFTPLFVIVIGALFFRIRAERKKVVGVLIGLGGLLLLILSKGHVKINDVGFTLLVLLATVLYGVNINMVGQYLAGVDAIRIATVSMAFIAIPAGIVMWQQNVFVLFQYDEAARISIATAVLLGIVGSAIATAVFYLLIQKAGSIFASLVTYAIPIVALFWGILANEVITVLQLLCLVVILCGVYIANKN
jgi:drug/metabolite transporter (DMT)-like permease